MSRINWSGGSTNKEGWIWEQKAERWAEPVWTSHRCLQHWDALLEAGKPKSSFSEVVFLHRGVAFVWTLMHVQTAVYCIYCTYRPTLDHTGTPRVLSGSFWHCLLFIRKLNWTISQIKFHTVKYPLVYDCLTENNWVRVDSSSHYISLLVLVNFNIITQIIIKAQILPDPTNNAFHLWKHTSSHLGHTKLSPTVPLGLNVASDMHYAVLPGKSGTNQDGYFEWGLLRVLCSWFPLCCCQEVLECQKKNDANYASPALQLSMEQTAQFFFL